MEYRNLFHAGGKISAIGIIRCVDKDSDFEKIMNTGIFNYTRKIARSAAPAEKTARSM